jgi:hypothetical protein
MFLFPKIVDVFYQSLFETDNRSEPPNTLSHEDLLILSGVRYDSFEAEDDNG